MVEVRPFRALRPAAERAARVAAPPYDVVSTAEARALAADDPDSFLHVSRPEIDLPEGTDPYAPEVYAQGRAALAGLASRGALRLDPVPRYGVYRQRMAGREQTGVVAVVSVAAYDSGQVAVHEHTRPDKELDRVRHIAALEAQDEPVFLLAPDAAALTGALADGTGGRPAADFTARDGVEHTLWTVAAPDATAALTAAFAAQPRLYVADGHHRSAAASRVAATRPDDADAQWFLAVVFPYDQVHVMAYHRVVELGPRTVGELLGALPTDFEITLEPHAVEPQRPHEAGLYADGQWYRLQLRPGLARGETLPDLDVSVLQDRILAPLLGIADPRTDERLSFVGGIRGTGELERLVARSGSAVAFSLPPTPTADLLAVADAGQVMPPKSTWFEPKLASGLFVHPFRSGWPELFG